MKRLYPAAALAVVLFAGAVSEARAAKPGPTTTFTQFSSVKAVSGCSANTDPTTDCTHAGVATAAGVLGGNADWTAWARLPEPGAVPIVGTGNSFGGGYGFVSYKVARGTKALEITARLNVQDPLQTHSEGAGFATARAYLNFSRPGCSGFDCEDQVTTTVPSDDVTILDSGYYVVHGYQVTLTQTIAAPEGHTLPEGTASLRVGFINLAGSPQSPGNGGTARGTLKLQNIEVTRR